MSKHASLVVPQTARANRTPAASGILQRRGGCGHAIVGVERAACQEENFPVNPQRVPVQHQSVDNGRVAHEVLRSAGQPLDGTTRGFMETRFGRDFSRVRVHTDGGAAVAAMAVNSRAYTIGYHVVFGAGQYVPGSDSGRRLVAHELAHVVQQNQSAGVPVSAERAEQEAVHVANRVVHGRNVTVGTSISNTIQHQKFSGMAEDVMVRKAVESGANWAKAGNPINPSAQTSHFESEQTRKAFIRGFIDYARRHNLKQQYEDARKTYPWADQPFPDVPDAVRDYATQPPAGPPPAGPGTTATESKADANSGLPMGGTYEDYKPNPDYIDNFSSAAYDPHSKTLHLFFGDGGEAILILPLQSTAGIKLLVFERKSLLNNPGPQDRKIYPTVHDRNTLPIVAQWLADHADEMRQSDLLLQAGVGALQARSVPPNLWWLALLAPTARIGARFASSRMRPAFNTAGPEPGETPIVRAGSPKGGTSPAGGTSRGGGVTGGGGEGGGGGAAAAEGGGGTAKPALKASGRVEPGGPGNKPASVKALQGKEAAAAPGPPLTAEQQRIAQSLIEEHPHLSPTVANDAAKGAASVAGKGGAGADVPLLNGGGRELSVHQSSSPFTAESIGSHLQQKAMQKGTTEIYLQLNSGSREGFLKILPGIRNAYLELRGVSVKIYGQDGSVWWSGTFGGPK